MSGKKKPLKKSRARHLELGLALKHKVSRLKRYIKRHSNDLAAGSALDKLMSKIK